jgi:hypothetical protein
LNDNRGILVLLYLQTQAVLLLLLLSIGLFGPLAWCFHQELQMKWTMVASGIQRPPDTAWSAFGKLLITMNVLGKMLWSMATGASRAAHRF